MIRFRRTGRWAVVAVVAVTLSVAAAGTSGAQPGVPTLLPVQPFTPAPFPVVTPRPALLPFPTPTPTPLPLPGRTSTLQPALQPTPAPALPGAPSVIVTPAPALPLVPSAAPSPTAAPTAGPLLPSPGAVASPAPAASPNPNASPGASPLPTGSPAPTPTPAPTPPPRLVSEGIELAGVFGSSISGMVMPASEFQVAAVIRAPDTVARVTLRMSGAPFLRSSTEFDLQPGDNWLTVPNFRVDNENEPVIREEVIRKVGGTIPIQNGALVMAIDYTDASGAQRTATFEPTMYRFDDANVVLRVEYPDLKKVTGLPENGAGEDNYYLRGNPDFHHPDDYYVRKLAIEAGRNGGVFPQDPEKVADNIFAYINSLLGDADPGDFNNDYNLARLIDDGVVRRGRINGGYICIGQTYFMTALTRTLGIPSRELNIAVGRPNWLGNDGLWRVTWWQEGAVHVWYNGDWHLYDLWLGFKGFDGYFRANHAYQAWATFNRQSTPFMTVGGVNTGLRGHNFNLWPGDPPHFEFVQEGVKPGVRVFGMTDETGEPVTRIAPDATPDGPTFYRAPLDPGAALPTRRGPTLNVGTPAASGILDVPESRP
jgi:hypothetical protein